MRRKSREDYFIFVSWFRVLFLSPCIQYENPSLSQMLPLRWEMSSNICQSQYYVVMPSQGTELRRCWLPFQSHLYSLGVLNSSLKAATSLSKHVICFILIETVHIFATSIFNLIWEGTSNFQDPITLPYLLISHIDKGILRKVRFPCKLEEEKGQNQNKYQLKNKK